MEWRLLGDGISRRSQHVELVVVVGGAVWDAAAEGQEDCERSGLSFNQIQRDDEAVKILKKKNIDP